VRPLVTVHVSTRRDLRGGENQVLMLAEGLRARGHRAILFAPAAGALAACARRSGTEVVDIPARSEADLRSILAMRSRLLSTRPDVVHLHDARAVTLGGIAARIVRLRAVVATRRVVFPLRGAWKWRRLLSRVIAISEAVRAELLKAGVAEEAIRLVRSAADPRRIEGGDASRGRKALDLGDGPVVLCVAALTEEKGHACLLEAFAKACKRLPGASLVLAGEGPLEPMLRLRAEALGIGPRVVFAGRRDDIGDLMAASDLFVLASRQEGLGSSVLDAMWCGLPVVVSGAGGLPEAVGDCGRIVPVGDTDALARAIVEALTDRETTLRLAREGSERARRLFSPDAMVEGTLAVYRELLETGA